MNTRAQSGACLLALASLIGCYNLTGHTVSDAGDAVGNLVADAADAREPGDAGDAGDAADALEVSDAVEVTDVVDAPSDLLSEDVSDAAGVADVAGAIDAIDVADTPDAAATVDVVDAVDACALTVCGGACVDTRSDVRHCGLCERDCTMLPSVVGASVRCEAGTCVIPTGACDAAHGDCDGDASNGCEADLTRSSNCGACGTVCSEPTPLCALMGTSRRCASGCDAASTRCGVSCANTANDPSNCGACGNVCPAPSNGVAACASGHCGVLCDAGFHLCGGRCVDDTLVANCGARCEPCALAAHATATCASGACGFTCDANFADCDGDATNGCETDTRTSGAHCGRCGNACTAPSGSVASCVAGRCEVMIACPTGQVLCGTSCQTVGATCLVGVGACARTGMTVCRADGGGTSCSVTPGVASTETCDGIDNDCDGLTDEGFCRIEGTCFNDGQTNPANACLRCVAPSTAAGASAWSNAISGTVCRAVAGPCDVAERCDGSGAACPPDDFVPAPRSYTRSTPSLPFIDACSAPGHQTYLPVTDDGSVAVTLPFSFNFFGFTFTGLGLSSNGVLSFPWNSNIREYFNQLLPYASIPNAVFAFWDDLMTGSNGVCVATVGSAPNRQFVAQWSDANFCCSADPASRMNFEVVLSEGTGTVDVRFGDTGAAPRASGDSATIGIQQGTGAAYDMVSYDIAGSAVTGRAYRWTPSGTVCRASVGACDVAESCSGAAVDCPADAVAPIGTACASPTGGTCAGGACTCPSGAINCGGGCTDTQTSPTNCGACGNVCPTPANSTATCVAGACGFSCSVGYGRSGGGCVSLLPAAWGHWRQVTVTNVGMRSLTDYAVRVALSASNFVFADARSDGADLLPLSADFATRPGWYLESFDRASQTATLWVRVPNLSALGTATFVLAYGNPAATSTSSLLGRYELFDDFNGSAVDPSLWTVTTPSGGSATTRSGSLVLSHSVNHLVTSIRSRRPFRAGGATVTATMYNWSRSGNSFNYEAPAFGIVNTTFIDGAYASGTVALYVNNGDQYWASVGGLYQTFFPGSLPINMGAALGGSETLAVTYAPTVSACVINGVTVLTTSAGVPPDTADLAVLVEGSNPYNGGTNVTIDRITATRTTTPEPTVSVGSAH